MYFDIDHPLMIPLYEDVIPVQEALIAILDDQDVEKHRPDIKTCLNELRANPNPKTVLHVMDCVCYALAASYGLKNAEVSDYLSQLVLKIQRAFKTSDYSHELMAEVRVSRFEMGMQALSARAAAKKQARDKEKEKGKVVTLTE